MRIQKPILGPVVAVILGAAAACHKAKEEGGEAPHAEVSVRTAVISAQPFTETLGALGVVVPRAGHSASLAAPGPARIADVLVTTGQQVVKGQPLIELDKSPFQATQRSAEAALDAAQRAYDRQERLAQAGIAARKDVDQATAELAKARADAAAAQRSAELSTLRSPISGVVTRMSASLGASVDANQQLVDIADPSALDILLNLTPSDAGRVRAGAKVSLSAGAEAAGEPLGIGTISSVGSTIDSASRSVAARVEVPATRRPLRIGETVYGAIALGTTSGTLVVPLEALVPEADGFKVFVVDATGIAHARPVTVGARTTQVVQIKSGVKAGERVVTYGAYGVSDSAKVVPLKP